MTILTKVSVVFITSCRQMLE